MTIRESVKPSFKAQSRPAVLLLGLTLLLVAFGLIMVASASVVDSYKETENAAEVFLRQGLYALSGLLLLVILSNLKLSTYRRFAPPALLALLVIQLVTVFFW